MTDGVFTASAIHAHRAMYMLNHARIGAMIAARNFEGAVKVLGDCGYVDLTGTVEKIVEHERARTFETFLKLCTDPALRNCVTILFKFKNTRLASNITLKSAENALEQDMKKNVTCIKNAQIRAYFNVYLRAWARGQKAQDRDLWSAAHELSMDFGGSGALAFWYAQKNFEFMAVRIILTGKILGLARERIMENLGGLYERFK
jgi:hypothetical protein